MKVTAVMAMLAAGVGYAGMAPAADMGRLFYTPAQRALLDSARRQNVSIEVGKEEEAEAAPQTLSLNGLVHRSDGKTTVWVNGRPISDQTTAGLTVSGGTVRIAVPDSGRIMDLKVGQTADIASGTVREGYAQSATIPAPTAQAEKPRPPSEDTDKIELSADNAGQFFTDGAVNGTEVRFLVDTGATMVSMSYREAERLGISYLGGRRGTSSTANGVVDSYRIKLDEVRVGNITLNNIDAVVQVNDSLKFVLLGMSFLNHMKMERDGNTMVLKRRF